MNQVNNEQRKTLTVEMRMSCYFVTGKDICYFVFDAFVLTLGRMVFFDFCVKVCKKVIILIILSPSFCELMKDHGRFVAIPILLTTSSKIQNSVAPLLFYWIINNLFDLTVWTKVSHGNNKARFTITAILTWSLKTGDVFADDYCTNLTFTACLESS